MLTLSEYVLKRNGVPLGSKGSLVKNLKNSFGAESNAKFWKYWNPIWGFYLSKFIYLPLKKYLPQSVAALVAFGVSGFFRISYAASEEFLLDSLNRIKIACTKLS